MGMERRRTTQPATTSRGRGPAVRRLPAGFVPFRTPVRGYRFAARPPGAEHPHPGQRVGLIREQAHPVDRWAVSVWLRAADGTPWRIGYLDRAVAARLGPRLDDGHPVRASVAGWDDEPARPWRRPVIYVEPDANRTGDVARTGRRRG